MSIGLDIAETTAAAGDEAAAAVADDALFNEYVLYCELIIIIIANSFFLFNYKLNYSD